MKNITDPLVHRHGMRYRLSWQIALLALTAVSAGCGNDVRTDEAVWAINVGGPAYRASDGTQYEAEASVSGGEAATLSGIKGSQDPVLYQSYRYGDFSVVHALPNGVYDLTFHFAEPDDVAAGEHLFDVLAESRVVIDDIDILRMRDGQPYSALTVTVPNIEVSDNELNIHFEAVAGEAMLSALVVRNKRPPASGWELAWSDEFNTGPVPDALNWNVEEWPPGVVNDEDQAYTARPGNLRIENGHLVIEAHKEIYDDAAYTSGRIQSSGKADFLYGRFEARAKLPAGQGTWPAIWMLPSNPFTYATTCEDDEQWQGSDTCDAWPNSGEIDIMEHVGYEMNHVHGTVHTKAYYWQGWQQRKGRILLDDVSNNFHVYALEWSPERIDIFVDDTLYFTYVNENSGWEEWPFDQPFHLILNVAVGGAWGRAGGPIDDDIFPQKMLVDYVRVYRRN